MSVPRASLRALVKAEKLPLWTTTRRTRSRRPPDGSEKGKGEANRRRSTPYPYQAAAAPAKHVTPVDRLIGIFAFK
eukprot:scaffold496411_cov42-Prasinocladus_malaysianus.AAC.1